MPPRFFSELPITDDSLTIQGDEVKHIVGAHRLGRDDEIVLFDGSGKEFLAKIEETQKKSISVSIIERRAISRELPFQLALAVALPKGDRQKVLVEKLVELGVSTLIPLNCKRSVAIASEKSVERLHRRVIEASKQCGRNLLMQIQTPSTLQELSSSVSGARFIAHPYDGQLVSSEAISKLANEPITVAVGPEGGFTDEEVELAMQTGWKSLVLGQSILRVETAAVCAAALFGIGRLTGD